MAVGTVTRNRVPKWQQRHDKKKEILNRLAEFERVVDAIAYAGSQEPEIAEKTRQHYDEVKQQLVLAIEELSRI